MVCASETLVSIDGRPYTDLLRVDLKDMYPIAHTLEHVGECSPQYTLH